MNSKVGQFDKGLSILYLGILALIGIVSAYMPALVTAVWALLILGTIYSFAKNDLTVLWYGVAASPALEIWERMSRAPFVPHELGKYYLLLVILLLFIQHAKRHSNTSLYHVGIVMLIMLLPSIIISLSSFDYENWVLNGLCIIELSLLLIFVARERWTVDMFSRVLKFGMIPIIPVLAYLTIKTPDFEKINFALGSNFKTSGDFGGNQLSTILGLGLVFTVILLQIKRPLIRIVWANYLLIAFILYRGFLTFSRGGMLVAGIAVIILFAFITLSSIANFLKFTLLLVILAATSVYIFNKVNDLTNNQLVLRYQGETAGTLLGTKQRTLNTITSYRLEIARTDLEMFKDYWLWGIGIGRAKDMRPEYGFNPIVSHTEYTRLLGEQGLGGLIAVLLLSFFPLWWIYKQKFTIWKAVTAALFTVAILTSFHSSMRTNTTIVCYLLAAMPVLYKKPNKMLNA